MQPFDYSFLFLFIKSRGMNFSTPTFHRATAADIAAMIAFILNEGPNEWNYLPPDGVALHIQGITTGAVQGLLALEEGRMVGLATFVTGSLASFPLGAGFNPAHASDGDPEATAGYVAEVVVERACAGRGIGARLLAEVVRALCAGGVRAVYAKRHEENAASAGMMRRAGFVEVAVFDDPAVRTSGSRRTSVSRYECRC